MSGSSSGTLPVWIGGLAVAGLVIAGGAWFVTRTPVLTDEAVEAALPEEQAAPDSPLSETLQDPAPQPMPDQAAEGTDAETGTGAAQTTTPVALPDPRLDEFRLDPDGVAVIAGRSVPGDTLILRTDGTELARASADADGAFATVAFLPPSEEARVLTLIARGADGRERLSPDEFIIAPMARAAPDPEPTPEPAQPVAEADPAGQEPDQVMASAETATSEPVPSDNATASTSTSDNAQDTAAPAQETAETTTVDPAPQSAVATSEDMASSDTAPDAQSAQVAAVAVGSEEQTVEAAVQTEEAASEESSTQTGGGTASDAEADTQTAETEPSETAEPTAQTPETTVAETPAAETAPADTQAADTPAPETPAVEEAPAAEAPADTQTAEAAPTAEAPDETPSTTAPDVQSTGVAPDAPQVSGNTALASAEAPTDPATSPPQVAILRSTPEGVEVVQSPGPRPTAQRRIALDAISYSAEGDVQLSGRAERSAAEVRIYLDNRPVGVLPVGAEGDWRGDVPDIISGVYTLRIDSVDRAGKVQSRVETPFKREAPEILRAAAEAQDGPVKAITVQKGATLWAIARARYGDPLLYVQVFEANRDQIRDPDLIYPGQVFSLPQEAGSD